MYMSGGGGQTRQQVPRLYEIAATHFLIPGVGPVLSDLPVSQRSPPTPTPMDF